MSRTIEPAPVPLATETSCPRCHEHVIVYLQAAAATVEVTAVRFEPEYVAHHRCPDQRQQLVTPRTDET